MVVPVRRHNDGSMMIALLLVLVVTSLAMVTMTTVLVSSKQTRNSVGQSAAHIAADQGVQQAIFEANSGKGAPTAAAPRTGSYSDSSYSWWAEDISPTVRLVHSTGVSRGVTRVMDARLVGTVTTVATAPTATSPSPTTAPTTAPTPTPTANTVGQPPIAPFQAALHGDLSAVFRGNNKIDSYNSSTGAVGTGQGAVSTNGAVRLNGNATADQVHLYNGATCEGTLCATIAQTKSGVYDVGNTQFIIDAMNKCKAAGPVKAYVASVNGPLKPGTYCYSSLLFDANTVPTSTLTSPAKIYTDGPISVERGVSVNVTTANRLPNAPKSGRLQIFTAGTSVAVGNSNSTNTQAAWGMYAPKAVCAGNPSNAQADLYGSLVCKQVGTQGGFNFHLDTGMTTEGLPGTPGPAPTTATPSPTTSPTSPPPTTTPGGTTVTVWTVEKYLDKG